MLLFNTGYILAVKPYLDPNDVTLDFLNCMFLDVVCIFVATYSAWNTNSNDKFSYGVGFDALVVLQFAVNIIYSVRQVSVSLIGKAKFEQAKSALEILKR